MPRLPPAVRQHTFGVPPTDAELPDTPPNRLITEHLQPMFRKLRPWIFAVDPGQQYAGLSWTRSCPELIGGETVGSRYATRTADPIDAVRLFSTWAEAAQMSSVQDPVLVIEEYRLFPDKVAMQTGKTIPTAENIGMFKWAAMQYDVRVQEQPASIKKPMAGLLNGRALKACGDSRHAKDAELHMWYFVLNKELPR
jgi:hypothetical protein